MAVAVGIDLGTTNTVIAKDGAVLPIQQMRAPPALTLGSCVAFTPSNQVVVGREAKKRAAIDPENTIVSSKRIIGHPWGAPEVAEYRQRYGAILVNDDRGPVFQTRAGPRSPVDIATLILEHALHGAGLNPGQTRAVITVPAAFSLQQRKATETAGKAAGLKEVALLEEPVATALAHGGAKNARYAAAYDIGGGTFDLCILDCTLWPIGILGHAGDLFLGGDDFDEAIAADLAATLLRERNWDLRTNNEAFRRLVAFSEQAKIELSTKPSVSLDLEEIDPGFPGAATPLFVDRALVGRSCYNLVRRTFGTCDMVFAELEMSAKALDKLFLAGGATQMPMVREWVSAYFGIAASPEVSPFEVVAVGASIAAREAFGGG